jgi:uncharacterized protein
VTLREELLEQHWSYMDRYRAQMIARGPALASDGGAPTGSVHIVGLPIPLPPARSPLTSPATKPGVYRDVLLRRWRNLLGHTIWDFPGSRAGGHRYLVLGLGAGRPPALPCRRTGTS